VALSVTGSRSETLSEKWSRDDMREECQYGVAGPMG
jgi:hypothetical protein